jgi:hypothetical protein
LTTRKDARTRRAFGKERIYGTQTGSGPTPSARIEMALRRAIRMALRLPLPLGAHHVRHSLTYGY